MAILSKHERMIISDIAGPFIVWEYYGYEGWQPKSYETLKEALSDQRFNSAFAVTKRVEYDVTECGK